MDSDGGQEFGQDFGRDFRQDFGQDSGQHGGERYLLFAWSAAGYTLHEREGELPAVGAEVEESERRYRVSKHASSPLPGDGRRCAYLQPV